MKIMITGFEPFGGSTINPSEQVVQILAARQSNQYNVLPCILPVDQLKGPGLAVQYLEEMQPDAVVMLGEARGRMGLSIERVAVNLLDFSIPDNAGNRTSDQAIFPDAPAAYFSTLPVRAMVESIQSAGVPAELSLTAGAYLCNQVMYSVLHWIDQHRLSMLAGFIHLPSLPEQVVYEKQKTASMSLDSMVLGISSGLTVLTDYWESSRNTQ
jgi:pyroglutamyl-peptidase